LDNEGGPGSFLSGPGPALPGGQKCDTMKLLLMGACLCLLSVSGTFGQLKDYTIGVKGDTLNGMDKKGLRQGKWVIRYDEVRGEAGYEEEGQYIDGKKEGIWRKYTLQGDLFGMEKFRWGMKDGISQYFNMNGELVKEESWRAFNPDKLYDTLEVEDVNHPDHYTTVIVKNEGSSIKNGPWKYFDPTTGFIIKTEFWILGKLEDSGNPVAKNSGKAASDSLSEGKAKVKPKEVLEFEKKNAGKKKIHYRDGSTSN
jgi:antitoxin component YwqK of YwqJK toxin-antitoxin module